MLRAIKAEINLNPHMAWALVTLAEDVVMKQLHLTRRNLIQALLEEHAIGPEELADCVGKEPRVISAMLKLDSHLRISDDLARQIEMVFSKPAYWLDGDDDDDDARLHTQH